MLPLSQTKERRLSRQQTEYNNNYGYLAGGIFKARLTAFLRATSNVKIP